MQSAAHHPSTYALSIISTDTDPQPFTSGIQSGRDTVNADLLMELRSESGSECLGNAHLFGHTALRGLSFTAV